jgi:hypothetical protein
MHGTCLAHLCWTKPARRPSYAPCSRFHLLPTRFIPARAEQDLEHYIRNGLLNIAAQLTDLGRMKAWVDRNKIYKKKFTLLINFDKVPPRLIGLYVVFSTEMIVAFTGCDWQPCLMTCRKICRILRCVQYCSLYCCSNLSSVLPAASIRYTHFFYAYACLVCVFVYRNIYRRCHS